MTDSVKTEQTSEQSANISVSASDLPLHCPRPQESLWNSHPKVYLPIKENGGTADCPYCGAHYTLK